MKQLKASKDVVFAKIGIIQRCLVRIKKTTNLQESALDDLNKQDIYVLNLQRAIQACIDLANHIVAENSLGVPASLKEPFLFLKENSVISADLCNKMESMVGFRNVAVHEYQELDVSVLKAILKNHLKDIDNFYKQILKKTKGI